MLYTRNSSYPAALPHAITLSNGFIRTDPSSFTAAEISDAGYVAAPDQPVYNIETEQLGWDGENWTVTALPQPPFPKLSGRQVLLALDAIGITEDQIDAAIDLIADLDARRRAKIEWRRSSTFERHHPLVDELAVAFSLPSVQVDALWRWAESI